MRAIAGVFVGGLASRMGGLPKGMMTAPGGGTIVQRWCAVLRAAGVTDIVLVGKDDAYAELGLEGIADAPAGIGPLGGIVALLRRAGDGHALAVACDMPFVTPLLIERLLSAAGAPVVAPRIDDRWEPFCARYDAPRILPVAERQAMTRARSLQQLLDSARAVELPLTPDEAAQLRDWDTPEEAGEFRSRPSEG
jgi:molybdopterin-guanine dinucleotide biosynthesis protein A